MNAQKRKFEYKWAILAVSFLMVFVCLGFCSGNKSLYLGAITDALDIPRSLFSINDTCRYAVTAILNLFFGPLIARFGAKKMVAFGFLTLVASMVIYATASHILLFYLGGILLGTGLAFTTNSIASYLIKHWFSAHLGRYLGIVMAANGAGGALAALIVTPIIYNGDPFGYRYSYLLIAAILLVVGIASVIVLREPPAHLAASPAPKKKARGVAWSGIPLSELKRKPWFYLTALTVFLTGFILLGIASTWATHIKDVGFDATFVAMVLSISNLILTVTKIVVGLIYDRFGLKPTVLVCQGAALIAFLSMAFLTVSTTGKIFSILFALLFSLALPLDTVVVPLIVNDLFGTHSYDQCLGYMLAFNYAGCALGAPIVNICYDATGSYSLIFLIFGGAMLVLSVGFFLTINAAYKTKKKIMEAENAIQAGT